MTSWAEVGRKREAASRDVDVATPTGAAEPALSRADPPPGPARPRSLASYLLLPRPDDAVKWGILPVGFGVGALTGGPPDPAALGRALLVWAVLELLIYPARYQVNDMIGFDADQQHPDGDRGRLPGPAGRKRSRITSSAAAALLKLAVAAVIAVLAPDVVGQTLLLVTLAVLATAVVYEPLRTLATGRTGQVPAPASAGVVAIWIVVGAGYAVRGVTGLSLAVDLGRSWWIPVAAVVAWWAFGVGWVTSRWAVEATAYGRLRADRLIWTATAAEAREHLLALVRWLPARPGPEAVSPEGDLRRWRPTSGATPLRSPWHCAAIVCGGVAAVTGWLLVDPGLTAGHAALALAAGMTATAVVAVSSAHRPTAAGVGAALLVALALVLDVRQAPLTAIPWGVATVAQVVYLRQCRASLGATSRLLRAAYRTVTRSGSRWSSAS